MQDQFASCIHLSQFVRNAIGIIIDLDGELQVIPFHETGEGKWMQVIFPLRKVDGDIRSLPWNELESFGPFYFKALYIVIDISRFEDFYNVFTHDGV